MRRFRILAIAALIVLGLGMLPSANSARAKNRLTLSTNPAYLYFGNQIVGTTSPAQNVVVKNTGSVNVKLGKLTVAGEFILRARDCNWRTLLPGESCTFSVLFQPLTAVYKTGSVTIPSNDVVSIITVSLTGYGISGTNLLQSPNFEVPLSKPVPWKSLTNAFTINQVLDCSVSFSPSCSIRFFGSPFNYNFPQTLQQTIPQAGMIDDKYIFRLSSRAKDIPTNGQYKVEVIFTNLYNQVVGSKTLYFTNGTHDFETVVGKIAARAQYTWVTFRFTLQKAGGTAWFDNAELIKLP